MQMNPLEQTQDLMNHMSNLELQLEEYQQKYNENKESLEILQKNKGNNKQWSYMGTCFMKVSQQQMEQLLKLDQQNLSKRMQQIRSQISEMQKEIQNLIR